MDVPELIEQSVDLIGVAHRREAVRAAVGLHIGRRRLGRVAPDCLGSAVREAKGVAGLWNSRGPGEGLRHKIVPQPEVIESSCLAGWRCRQP